MANAKKCDICGKFYDIYNTTKDCKNHNSFRFANVNEYDVCWNQRLYDCCPTCMEQIKSYIELMKKDRGISNDQN